MDRSITQGVRALPAGRPWSGWIKPTMDSGVRGFCRDELSPPIDGPNGHHQSCKSSQNANLASWRPNRRFACRRVPNSRIPKHKLLPVTSPIGFGYQVSAFFSKTRHFSPLLISHKVPCGPFRRIRGRVWAGDPSPAQTGTARHQHPRHFGFPKALHRVRGPSRCPASWQSRGRALRCGLPCRGSRAGDTRFGIEVLPLRQDSFPGSLPCATPGLPFK